jgi:hypothetical protein
LVDARAQTKRYKTAGSRLPAIDHGLNTKELFAVGSLEFLLTKPWLSSARPSKRKQTGSVERIASEDLLKRECPKERLWAPRRPVDDVTKAYEPCVRIAKAGD